MGISWVNRKGHVMGRWSPWHNVGNGQEMRSRHCLDAKCGETKTQWRKAKKGKKK